MMIYLLWYLQLILLPYIVSSQLCPASKEPKDMAAVSVWFKNSTGIPLYRISDEDLSDHGYIRSPHDRDNFVVLLARNRGECDNLCSLRLATNQREADEVVSHQENTLGVAPDGFQDLNDYFFCGRTQGACGADVPVFKYVNHTKKATYYAYSLDPAASFPGFVRDTTFKCFAWADEGSVVHPIDNQEHCVKMEPIDNGRITYSSVGSGAYPIGTTATLVCENGFAASGQSAVVCTKDGWHPETGLGKCVNQTAGLLATVGEAVACHDSNSCTQATKVENSQHICSKPAVAGCYPNGTSLTVICNMGFVPAGDMTEICVNGSWTQNNKTRCIPNSEVVCKPFLPAINGAIRYEPDAGSENPYAERATAEVLCNEGYAVRGTSRTICENGQWGAQLGTCESTRDGEESNTERSRRQINTELQCQPLTVPNGFVTYLQGSAQLLYGPGTTANLLCNFGFQPAGTTTATCFNGQWNAQMGQCNPSSFGATGMPNGNGINSGSSGLTCSGITTPMNGQVTYSNTDISGMHAEGSTVSLLCNSGMTVSGSMSAICSNGQWSPQTLGNCQSPTFPGGNGITDNTIGGGLECANPFVFNGIITYNTASTDIAKPVGTVATLQCNVGTTLVGSGTSSCSNGQWTPALGTCSGTGTQIVNPPSGQTCSAPFPPLFGTLSYSANGPFGPFNTGTTMTLTCSNGQPMGAATSTCQSGTWQPALGQCPTTQNTAGPTGAQCSAVFPPFGASVKYSQNDPWGPFSNGVTVTLTCPAAVQGPSTSTCTNGQWSPTLGTCSSGTTGTGGGGLFDTTSTVNSTVGSCPFPPMVALGATATYSNGLATGPFPAGTTVTMTCPSGQTLSGSATTTCNSGIWSPLGTCQMSGFGGGSTVPGATAFLTLADPTPTTSTTTTVTPATTPMAPLSATTPAPFSWESIFGLRPPSNCLFGIFVLTGTVTYSNNGSNVGLFPSGTVATLSCSDGDVIGPEETVCQNGVFTPPLGFCTSEDGDEDAEVEIPVSQMFSVCLLEANVPPLGSVTYSNGGLFGPFLNGTKAYLSCPAGYYVDGSDVSTCNDPYFYPEFGVCRAGSSNSNATTVEEEQPSLDVGSAACFSLSTPLHSSITYTNFTGIGPFPTGTVASMTCDIGYTMAGERTSVCRNGQWDPSTVGTCVNGQDTSQCIFALASVPHGKVSYSDGKSIGPFVAGTTATLSCDANFVGRGSATSTCTNGHWTSPILGPCLSRASTTVAGEINQLCSPISLMPYATVTYNEFGFGPYHSGTVAMITCHSGATLSGTGNPSCISGKWEPTPGSCQPVTRRAPVAFPLIQAAPTLGNPFISSPSPLGIPPQVLQGDPQIVLSNQCSTPFTPPFGEITYSSPSNFGNFAGGTTAALKCNIGYVVSGPSFSKCSSGQFRPVIGRCVSDTSVRPVEKCGPVPPPKDGRITYIQSGRSGDFDVGTTALLYCDHGFLVNGQPTMLCSPTGWEPASGLGTCQPTNG